MAQRFRDELAKGKIPIPTCVRCTIKRLPKNTAPPKPHLPHRGMLLENTVLCNVDCIGCAREGAAAIRSNKRMPLEDLGRMADLVHRLKMEKLFYLNLGEPFLSPTICQELPLLRAKNPDCWILVSTNGMLLNTDAKREAALNLSHILFSVHGISDEMSAKYMLRGSFEKAYAAMKAMVAYRDARGLSQPVLEWKYLLFNWNDHPKAIQRAIEMAKEIDVDIISFWPTHNPFYGMSWRYHLGRMNHIGVKSWKGREVILRPDNVVTKRFHYRCPPAFADRAAVPGEMSLDAAGKVCDVIAEFYGNKNARNARTQLRHSLLQRGGESAGAHHGDPRGGGAAQAVL